ncbi:DUF2460 domain-containing protein [Lysobacter sp. 5GHs7-4]|uniref:DUF2460 domain-containing protein n=1 Tax=Lysobacter sp. 5GHs7-4 TaxID=2904253 RepID=UPI001E563A10|nr:DUF2460 domain-containing protein [Lysobacter sp. 5GHs7-4]UHQ21882.1 DUF2460 domain-containing protein [Lysobacter sp. 5GHs7-4]
MSFVNVRMPTCVAYGFTGGPAYSTLVVPLENGREQRNRQWFYPRHQYSAQYLNLDLEAQRLVLEIFHALVGQLHCCRFKDHNDYQAFDEPLAPAIGTSTAVQLIKTYSMGPQATTRLIQAPVAGAVIKRNGVAVAGTLDVETGLFTPDAPWASGTYTWTGEFDVWVRFASDYNAFQIGNVDAHTADIELIEVRR